MNTTTYKGHGSLRMKDHYMVQTKNISFNMNLGNAIYEWTIANARNCITFPKVASDDTEFSDRSEAVLHIQLHWGRKPALDEPMATLIESRVRTVFEEIKKVHHVADILIVDIIDCGDIAMEPLSGFSVLNYLLEVVAEYVNPDCKCRVFSVNYDDLGILGEESLTFDTASEEFREYLMAFIKASLSEVNQRSGANFLLNSREAGSNSFKH